MSQPEERKLSKHPTDVLIRALAQRQLNPTAQNVIHIVERMAEAPFPTVSSHLWRRLRDEQWSRDTTEDQYLDDLRRAVRHRDTRICIYQRRGGNLAAALAATHLVVQPCRLGDCSEQLLFVVYSADRGIIISGYQVSSLEALGLPKEVVWLR